MTLTARSALVDAHDLLLVNENWTTIQLARNETGKPVDPWDDTAVSWCATGGLHKVGCKAWPNTELDRAYRLMARIAQNIFHYQSVEHLNDACAGGEYMDRHKGHLLVLDLFKRTIAWIDHAPKWIAERNFIVSEVDYRQPVIDLLELMERVLVSQKDSDRDVLIELDVQVYKTRRPVPRLAVEATQRMLIEAGRALNLNGIDCISHDRNNVTWLFSLVLRALKEDHEYCDRCPHVGDHGQKIHIRFDRPPFCYHCGQDAMPSLINNTPVMYRKEDADTCTQTEQHWTS